MAETNNHKLLIVDDDDGLLRQLRWAFDECDVVMANDRQSALDAVGRDDPKVILLDLGLPPDPDGPTEGLATLEQILSESAHTKVIMMSGQTEREYAVRAVGLGAYDFYQKPIEKESLNLAVQRAFNLYDLEEENQRLQQRQGGTRLPGIISANDVMLRVCDDAAKYADSDVSVLVVGESGTGKELMARAVHALSARADGPLIAINCAAIPENLLESELFGYEKGAFTGATKTTAGMVEQANKGTLFLDEIGDMPIALQAKLLRFLEDRSFQRIGGRRDINVDIRVVSATNKDLAQAIVDGSFREDLFYRLAETEIRIPPLRDRPDDALIIAQHILLGEASKHNRPLQRFTPGALTAIAEYDWPGNVRELQNRIRRAVLTASGQRVTAEDLDFSETGGEEGEIETLREARERAERMAVTRAVLDTNGNISKAAGLLQTSRPTVYQLLQRYNIQT
jgi:two-component system NtrC family response regulator